MPCGLPNIWLDKQLLAWRFAGGGCRWLKIHWKRLGGESQRGLSSPGKGSLRLRRPFFARQGLNGTRIRKIAEAAGVNNATLYTYFPSKTELYEAVIERGIRPLINLVTEFSAGTNDMEAARKLVREGMKHLRERPNLSRLIYLEIISEGATWRSFTPSGFVPCSIPELPSSRKARNRRHGRETWPRSSLLLSYSSRSVTSRLPRCSAR